MQRFVGMLYRQLCKQECNHASIPGGELPYNYRRCREVRPNRSLFGNIFHNIYFKGDCYRHINRVWKFPAYHKQGMEIHFNFINRVWKFLRSMEPLKVADAIVDLAHQIEQSCDAMITISELTTRSDCHKDAVKSVNKRLHQYCRQNQWNIVNHNNITETSLNKGGLHLSRQGNELLYKSFKEHFMNDKH